MYRIEQEKPADLWEVEALYDLCFAPGREALSSYRLREGVSQVAEFSLVARDTDNTLAAAIRYWPVLVGPKAALLLGPIAVHPTRQGEGLGDLLMRTSLDLARVAGWKRVLLVGDLPYYQRFGFDILPDVIMPAPSNPARVLGYSLTSGAWDMCVGEVCKYV
ncbi:GNAT family N-acetyltransferase [Falsihalocynthiibacter sp. S25ZX9]|uniref:GNAT family N-acetyltransferase n=1 Tax=Falsihalocynthiibacter sp. S25ZX9 TaxID=3240870 RepID=UPI00350EB5D8